VEVEMDDIVEVIRNIEGGGYDKYLVAIGTAVKNRQEAMRVGVQSRFQIGDKVRFCDNTKPAYMQGVEATVIGRKVKKYVVAIDQNMGRFRAGQRITAPPSILELRIEDMPKGSSISELLKDVDLGDD
jgi:hypothetical protein